VAGDRLFADAALGEIAGDHVCVHD